MSHTGLKWYQFKLWKKIEVTSTGFAVAPVYHKESMRYAKVSLMD
jgi:hypothetical protein